VLITYHDIIRILSPHVSHILVDKVTLFEHRSYLLGYKNVSLADIGFWGKELRLISAPELMIMESMSQFVKLFLELSGWTGRIMESNWGNTDTHVVPGDTLCLELRVVKSDQSGIELQGRVLRDGLVICSPQFQVQY
jgi:3-hydroxymyristoyl/3-hydroxydecanoyl-(acyl carrier protein) dehydratase